MTTPTPRLHKRAAGQPRNAGAYWDTLMAAAGRLEGPLRALVWQALIQMRRKGAPSFKELVALLEAGRVEEITNRHLAALDGVVLRDGFRRALVEAARLSAPTLVREAIRFSVDLFNPRAVSVVQQFGSALVREIEGSVRTSINGAIVEGLKTGVNPRATARTIRDVVGLTERQWRAVMNYRAALETGDRIALQRALRDRRFDPTVRRAVLGEQSLTAQQIDTMVTRYAERYVKYRAEVIARTESIRALAEGRRLLWNQVFADPRNDLDKTAMVRFWVVARDERLCAVCSEVPGMNPDGVAFDQPFATPNGAAMEPPLHPQCRCVVFAQPRSSVLR